jgi:hypothetical protein
MAKRTQSGFFSELSLVAMYFSPQTAAAFRAPNGADDPVIYAFVAHKNLLNLIGRKPRVLGHAIAVADSEVVLCSRTPAGRILPISLVTAKSSVKRSVSFCVA